VIDSLAGKTVLVTGAGSGIGRALAVRCAAESATVVVVDRDRNSAEETCRLIGQEASLARVADVSIADDVEALAASVWDEVGPVDVLLSNAGVLGPVGDPVWEIELADWQRVLSVNFYGAVHALRSFVPRFIANGTPSHVVVTASMAGMTPSPIVAPYYASKRALVAMVETFQRQVKARGLDLGVSLLCPGSVTSNIVTTELALTQAPLEGGGPTQANLAEEVTGTEASHIDPAIVAESVIEAIYKNRLYVFVNAGSRERVRDYFEEMVS
jgi:NAD(P)-dependent dehydrogenase (short-subunit alcohol dehydrogenase family)